MAAAVPEFHQFGVRLLHIRSRQEYLAALPDDSAAVVLVDEDNPIIPAAEALALALGRQPAAVFVGLSEHVAEDKALRWIEAGAHDYVSKRLSWRLAVTVRSALKFAALAREQHRRERREQAMAHLIGAVQDLSLARDLASIQSVVRRAARELTGADGATFVLRDQDRCFYADEDAIGPLWKGQRFPMSSCISGWVMTHREPVAIEDIFQDSRIPHEVYRTTFVKSMLMVPIRTDAPIGAIGNYWAGRHRAHPEEIELLQALANTTAVAIENVGMYADLEARVKDRTQKLEKANRELESFSYAVSHDLRAPLTAILGYADLLTETAAQAGATDLVGYCERIVQQSHRMNDIIRDLLRLAKATAAPLHRVDVDLSALGQEIVVLLREAEPERQVSVTIAEGLTAHADRDLVRIVLENLFSNAWKYSRKVSAAKVEFGQRFSDTGETIFWIRDNGAGFNPAHADRLFVAFQRLHAESDFPGTGVGLATVHRIVAKHGGRVWADAAVGRGATFYFTLPPNDGLAGR